MLRAEVTQMTKVFVRAIEPCDGHKPGDRFEVPERQARELVQLGLVKMMAPLQNKMAPAPANKANPSPAAGRVRRSSASPAARVSPPKTAQPSDAGALEIPTLGGSSRSTTRTD
jgi:uncharacterized membrane protein